MGATACNGSGLHSTATILVNTAFDERSMGFLWWEPRRRTSEECLARLQGFVESLDSYPLSRLSSL